MSKGGAIRWTEAELAEHRKKLGQQKPAAPPASAKPPAKPKRSKYRSKKVVVDGITHDSEKEARRWATLEMLQQAGLISDLRRQVRFELVPKVKLAGEARTKPALRYWADFVYMQDGVQVVEDVKSPPTRKKEAYRIKRHLMATVHGIHIKEI